MGGQDQLLDGVHTIAICYYYAEDGDDGFILLHFSQAEENLVWEHWHRGGDDEDYSPLGETKGKESRIRSWGKRKQRRDERNPRMGSVSFKLLSVICHDY